MSHHVPCPAKCLTCALKRTLLDELATCRRLTLKDKPEPMSDNTIRAIAELIVDKLATWNDEAGALVAV